MVKDMTTYALLDEEDFIEIENNLAKKGIKAIFRKDMNIVVAEKSDVESGATRKIVLMIGNYILEEVQGNCLLSEINPAKIDIAKDVAVEYYKHMLNIFGGDYKNEFERVLVNNIESLNNVNEIGSYKKYDIKLEKRNIQINFYEDILKEVLGKDVDNYFDMKN